jgi:predicted amino acid-binding ACT domain protein
MQLSVSIFGRDEPGVIATLTTYLKEIGANIEDASMTLLQGFFAMIMVVELDESSVPTLVNDLQIKEELKDFVVNVTEVKNDQQSKVRDTSLGGTTRYVLKMSVNDTVGIVAQVTKILSDNKANIVDFRTVRDNATDKFSLFLDVDVYHSSEEIVSFEIANLSNAYEGYIDFNTVDDIDL